MYGKLFSSMYEGTLYGQWQAIVTLQQLVILADADGVVDMTPPAIAARTSIPLDIISTGIDQLSQPDRYSRTPTEDGRRIVLLEEDRPWGWRIVNYRYYRELASREDKKAKDRERIAAKRLNNNGVAQCRAESQNVADVAHTNTDTDTNTGKSLMGGKPPPSEPDEFIELRKIYPKRSGDQRWKKALQHCRARLKEGHTWEEILDGARRYAAWCKATDKIGTETVKQAATFVGTEKGFTEPWTPPKRQLTPIERVLKGEVDERLVN